MNEENNETAGIKSLKTFRKVRMKFQTKRTVINVVPTKASGTALLSVMVVSINAVWVGCNSCHERHR